MSDRMEYWERDGKMAAFTVTNEEVILTYELWSQILEELGFTKRAGDNNA